MSLFSKWAGKTKATIIDEIPGEHQQEIELRLNKIQAELAALVAHEKTAKRRMEDAELEITRLDAYTRKALEAGEEEQAKEFLRKKLVLEEKVQTLKEEYQIASNNTNKMQELRDKLLAERGNE